MNEPAIPATTLTPRAMPRCLAGNTSVRIATELASSIEPPMAWITRQAMSQIAPFEPSNGSSDSRIDVMVNRAKPAL